ncbi:GNAT family N-acetyltransferase [Flavobacteriales bacterium]|jgi:diamine N-acetyltransferase|nr:GNAT family N-acetyltransferase [Flavobacteriales bacterium]
MLVSAEIKLRTLKDTDLDFLFSLENDKSLWAVSGTTEPFSLVQLANYISHAKQDIAIAEQFRFVIDCQGKAIGCIDLYEYNFKKQNAGVGIVILKEYRRKGFAKQSLTLLIKYAWEKLHLKQLHTGIFSDNKASLALFQSVGFEMVRQNNFVLKR